MKGAIEAQRPLPAAQVTPASRARLQGYACAAALVLIWAGFGLASRWAAREGAIRMTPWDLGALRFAVAGTAAAALWCAGYGRGLPVRRSLAIGIVAGPLFALLAFTGFSMAPAAHAAVLMPGTLPFMVGIGFWWAFGEAWTRARVLSLALAGLGAVLLGVESYGYANAPPGAWRGDLLFLSASVCWAGFTVLARRWGVTAVQAIVSVGLWGAALFLPVYLLGLPSRLHEVPAGQIAFQAFYQGFVSVVVATLLYTQALLTIGAARLTTVTALTPGLAGLAAVPLLGEHIGALAMTGLLLVCAGVAVGVRPARKA